MKLKYIAKMVIYGSCLGMVAATSTVAVAQSNRIYELKQEKAELIQVNLEQENLITELSNFNLAELPIEDQFKVAAQIYETDWTLIYAIAAHETGWFSSRLFKQQNNPGGIKAGSGWASYDNSFQGICEMTRLIKKSYIDKGLTTPEKMESKYCPDGSAWAKRVNSIMSELKNNEEAH